ncbi:hypothetical protein BT93_L0685 [Corymbia citriodora subsp. variegata]|uniref:NAD(P)-binding protein n=1 Tax=Corymbia citriodora subsp. variegata TaxID=360336 RepID=A0A8T0CEP0_CORYI|nr:hypothetical protein BT93_L0685 [Corymbia citriodora subsp. variegata]
MVDLLRSDVLAGLTILITGASSGIGRATAIAAAKSGCHALILFARSTDKLEETKSEIQSTNTKTICILQSVDVQSSKAIYDAVRTALSTNKDVTHIDVLINNAGLALGAPARFPELKLEDIDTMTGTNLSGMLYTTHAVLNVASSSGSNSSMLKRGKGTIMNITSTTAMEVPPFPGECIYHTTKAAQEAFTNSLRTELQETNIKVIALRPGVVGGTVFHKQRIGFDEDQYNEFMKGFQSLNAEDVAGQIIWVLATGNRQGNEGERVSVKVLEVVPTAQRMLYVIDKTWNQRNGVEDEKMG